MSATAAVFTARDSIIAKIAAKTLEEVIRNMEGFQLSDVQSLVANSALSTLQEVVGAAMKRVAAAEARAKADARGADDSARFAPPSLHNLAMKCIAGDLHDYRNVIALAARALSERVAFGGSSGWFIFRADLKRFAPMSADLAELHEALWDDVAVVFGEEHSYLASRARDGLPGAADMAARAVCFQNKLSLDRSYRSAVIQAWEVAMRNRR